MIISPLESTSDASIGTFDSVETSVKWLLRLFLLLAMPLGARYPLVGVYVVTQRKVYMAFAV